MDYVSRDTARVIAIGVVSIVAISMGAATIQTTVDFGTGTAAGGFEIGESGGQAGGLNDSASETNSSIDMEEGEGSDGFIAQTSTCVETARAVVRRTGLLRLLRPRPVRDQASLLAGASFLGMYAIAPVALTAYFFTTDCTSALGGGNEQSGVVEGIGDAAGQGVVSTDVSPAVVVGVFAVALVATAVVLYRCVGRPDGRDGRGRRGGGTRPAGRQGPGSRPRPTRADRLEERNADVDNEVYAAWRDMTALLRVSKPESPHRASSPRRLSKRASTRTTSDSSHSCSRKSGTASVTQSPARSGPSRSSVPSRRPTDGRRRRRGTRG